MDTNSTFYHKKTNRRLIGSLVRLGIVLIALAVLTIALCRMLRGSETTSGAFPANVTNESLVCSSKNIKYKKITAAESDDTDLNIIMIFSGTQPLKSISLTYTMGFENAEEVKKAETFSHAEFNYGLADLGYASDKFANKFSQFSDRLTLSLFANANELDLINIRYFALNDSEDDKDVLLRLPNSLAEYKKVYQNAGFSCTSTSK